MSSIFILYVGIQTVAQGALGHELANNTEAPLVAVATQVFGDWGAKMLLAGGAISIFGTLSGDMLAAPRVVFASARDGLLPRVLARVHPTYQTPYVSIVFFAAVACAFALSESGGNSPEDQGRGTERRPVQNPRRLYLSNSQQSRDRMAVVAIDGRRSDRACGPAGGFCRDLPCRCGLPKVAAKRRL